MRTVLPWLSLMPSLLPAGETISLFNGEDLAGWKADIPAADSDPAIAPSFVVREGKLVSLGNPRGQLLTEREFGNYRLVAEYRFPGEPGNCGILVHCSRLRARADMLPSRSRSS